VSGLEATLTGLFTTADVLSPNEDPSLATIATGVLAVAFAFGSRFSFVTRNRALMRAAELPHEFSDARHAELAALTALAAEQLSKEAATAQQVRQPQIDQESAQTTQIQPELGERPAPQPPAEPPVPPDNS
jgi:hypothetical protein